MDGIAVVTGAGSGIGAATARALAADGWTVVLSGRRREPLEQVAQALPEALVVPADVTDEASVRALFAAVLERYGRLDLLVNNAGSFLPPRDLDAVTLSEWESVFAVNVTGVFLCSREAFRIMREQSPRGGRIVNNGSLSAQVPRPLAAAYTAAKHAVTGLTKSLSLDGRPHGVACGQIDVGNAATPMTEAMAQGAPQPDGSVRPEPRMDADDVGRAVAFMASLPLEANVANLTVLATQMPYAGRG